MDQVRDSVDKVIDFYREQGHKIVEVSLPTTELSIPVYYVIATAEASSNLARYDGIRYTSRSKHSENAIDVYAKSRGEGFGEEVKEKVHPRSLWIKQWILRCILFEGSKNKNFNQRRFQSGI